MATAAPARLAAGQRINSIDAVRGLAMAVMALDHVREFFLADNLRHSLTRLGSTTPGDFLTRWVTHFCAPAFVLLTGVGAFLWAAHGRSRRELSWFLVTRGLWLVFLELTVVRCLGWYFNFNYHEVIGQVIWAIGWSMIVLAGLVHLPRWAIGAVAFAIIAGHNLLDDVPADAFGPFAWLWAILHSGDPIDVLPGVIFRPVYPLLPWIGVMAAGYFCAPWMAPNYPKRRRVLASIGAALILAFVVVRGLNVYGDPDPWSVQKDTLYTAFSFFNCTKYPPSLAFLLMTLGPTFLLLAALDRRGGPALKPLVTLGRVPLFFYVVHLSVIHGLAGVFCLLQHGEARGLFISPPWSPGCAAYYPEGYGYHLPTVYALWILVLVLLWPACEWYARLKRQRHGWFLSYL
jgi:uncharacterized membrane protein